MSDPKSNGAKSLGLEWARGELKRGIPAVHVLYQVGDDASVEFWAGVRQALDEHHKAISPPAVGARLWQGVAVAVGITCAALYLAWRAWS